MITYTTPIRGYTKMSDIEGAESVRDRLVEQGVARNDFTYTLQQGYIRVGDFDAAHSMLVRMEEDGAFPDSVSYIQLIAGYAKKGRVGEAESVFASMPMLPTLKAYLALARAYVNASDVYGDGWRLGSLCGESRFPVIRIGSAHQIAFVSAPQAKSPHGCAPCGRCTLSSPWSLL